ncbi:MAG TPA: class I SAM-dependent methyltransferase [candidate division Zixibacteria bacterium]|nr:class I SAM-dependent methyltransferase [candidate division Zixibacteria bacterium]
MDEISKHNEKIWSEWVDNQSEYTRPWIDLDPGLVRDFAAGKIDPMPRPYMYAYPQYVFSDVCGKKVLCLATGGGQQSAVFGLLGADVTVVDLTEGQLSGDRKAAAAYGFRVTTIKADMRDLSALADDSFDLVYQAISIVFVPDTRPVYREVARVLKPGGLYRVGHMLPNTYGAQETDWTGAGYSLKGRYRGGPVEDADAREFRHLLPDIFTALVEAGFRIKSVHEDPRHLHPLDGAVPGTWDHMSGQIAQYFCIVAERG